MSSRFVVGIDLGTTNSAVAYVDTQVQNPNDDAHVIESLSIPQVVSPGEVEDRPTLPSFLLLPNELEVPPDALSVPWATGQRWAVGTLARDRGADLPHRLVSSAKSWLSHTGVDRTAPILPFRGADTDEHAPAERVSPVEASARYLVHLRQAWNLAHPDAPLEQQDVFLTVPASF